MSQTDLFLNDYTNTGVQRLKLLDNSSSPSVQIALRGEAFGQWLRIWALDSEK